MTNPCKLHYIGHLYCPYANSCNRCKHFKRKPGKDGKEVKPKEKRRLL
jgi:hypothetical protein